MFKYGCTQKVAAHHQPTAWIDNRVFDSLIPFPVQWHKWTRRFCCNVCLSISAAWLPVLFAPGHFQKRPPPPPPNLPTQLLAAASSHLLVIIPLNNTSVKSVSRVGACNEARLGFYLRHLKGHLLAISLQDVCQQTQGPLPGNHRVLLHLKPHPLGLLPVVWFPWEKQTVQLYKQNQTQPARLGFTPTTAADQSETSSPGNTLRCVCEWVKNEEKKKTRTVQAEQVGEHLISVTLKQLGRHVHHLLQRLHLHTNKHSLSPQVELFFFFPYLLCVCVCVYLVVNNAFLCKPLQSWRLGPQSWSLHTREWL